MDRNTCIEVFTAASLAIVGLSHIVQPRLWAQLFLDLMERPYAGLYVGTITLTLGLLVALGHNVWVWDLPVIVTIIGWSWALKGSIYLLRPATLQQTGVRHMQHPRRFQIAGAIAILAALVIAGSIAIDRM